MVTFIDNSIIEEYVDEGLITARPHPRLPLRVLNYTKQCQYGNLWNWFTTQARGLVVDESGNIVARGFDKFFNLEEHGSLDLPTSSFVAYDKLDGSLIIAFRYEGEVVVCSRGSFESDHAYWAQEIIDEAEWDGPSYGCSACFELIHPDNRIVVDYGDMRDLVYLGHRSFTGEDWWFPEDTPFPAAERFLVGSVDQLPHRSNAEGFVLHWPNGFRVKVKYDDYVEIHRAVFGLTERKVLDAVRRGENHDLRAKLPEEFHDWYDGIIKRVWREFLDILRDVNGKYKEIKHIESRRDFAREAMKHRHSSMLFALRDNKPFSEQIWKIVEQSIKRESNEPSRSST